MTRVAACYPFIEAEKQRDHNVKRACELLKVSRSAYYADRASRPSMRAQRDAELTGKIATIHDDSRHTYGAPRVHHELRAQGEPCSRKRVARLMRAADRRGRAPRRWKTTTIADPAAPARPDLIGRDFAIDLCQADVVGLSDRMMRSHPYAEVGIVLVRNEKRATRGAQRR
ncbi:IS3 family transposase [Kribbella pratensis]|uniref:Helix-turn-helix protein n=1 Tax=Kribbella pratensis TaxID=2512112 RepID=A0A4R8CJ83_9ACTN|nr:IS3 family transposase [Kribbella pratensis]TDW76274.1 helix-turn-helix protein [Kribbella pratensis]